MSSVIATPGMVATLRAASRTQPLTVLLPSPPSRKELAVEGLTQPTQLAETSAEQVAVPLIR